MRLVMVCGSDLRDKYLNKSTRWPFRACTKVNLLDLTSLPCCLRCTCLQNQDELLEINRSRCNCVIMLWDFSTSPRMISDTCRRQYFHMIIATLCSNSSVVMGGGVGVGGVGSLGFLTLVHEWSPFLVSPVVILLGYCYKRHKTIFFTYALCVLLRYNPSSCNPIFIGIPGVNWS